MDARVVQWIPNTHIYNHQQRSQLVGWNIRWDAIQTADKQLGYPPSDLEGQPRLLCFSSIQVPLNHFWGCLLHEWWHTYCHHQCFRYLPTDRGLWSSLILACTSEYKIGYLDSSTRAGGVIWLLLSLLLSYRFIHQASVQWYSTCKMAKDYWAAWEFLIANALNSCEFHDWLIQIWILRISFWLVLCTFSSHYMLLTWSWWLWASRMTFASWSLTGSLRTVMWNHHPNSNLLNTAMLHWTNLGDPGYGRWGCEGTSKTHPSENIIITVNRHLISLYEV